MPIPILDVSFFFFFFLVLGQLSKSYLALVILPDDSELNDPLRDRGDLQGLAVLGLLLEQRRVLQGRGKLCVKCRGSVDFLKPVLTEQKKEANFCAKGD